MLSDDIIELAKASANYAGFVPVHQNNDCIRIAYAWLDAQIKTPGLREVPVSQRGLIRAWGGALVMYADIIVAAEIHPAIKGVYPNLNVAEQLTLPLPSRLAHIPGAHEHPALKQFDTSQFYAHIEE